MTFPHRIFAKMSSTHTERNESKRSHFWLCSTLSFSRRVILFFVEAVRVYVGRQVISSLSSTSVSTPIVLFCGGEVPRTSWMKKLNHCFLHHNYKMFFLFLHDERTLGLNHTTKVNIPGAKISNSCISSGEELLCRIFAYVDNSAVEDQKPNSFAHLNSRRSFINNKA